MKLDQNFPYALMLIRSGLGLLCANFSKYTRQLWSLVIVNFIFAQYLGIKVMEFDQILHMHICWPDERGILFLCCPSVHLSVSQSFTFWFLSGRCGMDLISTAYWHYVLLLLHYFLLLAHLSTKCSWWAIVVSQCPSSVMRRQQLL